MCAGVSGEVIARVDSTIPVRPKSGSVVHSGARAAVPAVARRLGRFAPRRSRRGHAVPPATVRAEEDRGRAALGRRQMVTRHRLDRARRQQLPSVVAPLGRQHGDERPVVVERRDEHARRVGHGRRLVPPAAGRRVKHVQVGSGLVGHVRRGEPALFLGRHAERGVHHAQAARRGVRAGRSRAAARSPAPAESPAPARPCCSATPHPVGAAAAGWRSGQSTRPTRTVAAATGGRGSSTRARPRPPESDTCRAAP